MNKNVNIVIPMAGLGSRFSIAGYEKPKPFIDILGKPMIWRVLENLEFEGSKFILIARKEHVEMYSKTFEEIAKRFDTEIVVINRLTEGMACTVLYARSLIDNTNPVLLANSDQIIDISIEMFVGDCIDRKIDGSILCFRDEFKDPKWSFVKVGMDGLVTAVAEKKPISDMASVGIYFYTRGKDFVDCAIDMIVRGDKVNNEYYTCPTYNYAVQKGLKVGIYEIPYEKMHGVGTPADLDKYLTLRAEGSI